MPAHDEHTVPGNFADDEMVSEGVAVTIRDGVAGFRPIAFDRLSEEQGEHAAELMLLVGQRRQLAREIDEMVEHMRGIGCSWGVIGWCVGTSSEAARQRWASWQGVE